MENGVAKRGRGRGRMLGVLAAATALTLCLASVPAGASPIGDADAGAAAVIGQRLAEIDAVIRLTGAALPGADAAVGSAAAAQAAARAEERRVLAGGVPVPGAGSDNTFADASTNAILADLAPEQVVAARVRADVALLATTTSRDDQRRALYAAADERTRLLAELEARGLDRMRWSVALLDRLGDPITLENLRGLAAWIDAEANGAGFRNPLATTMGAPGARDANEVGVKAYPSDDVGLDATVRTLHNGGYPQILKALASGDSALQLTVAIAGSKWGTGDNARLRLLTGP